VAIGNEVVRGLDQAAYRAASFDLETLRIKQAVARDLHDSVAQSLAGARYWLRSLKSGPHGEAIATELDAIDETLGAEQQQIRAMIEVLRGDGQPLRRTSILVELGSLCDQLARRWGVDIKLEPTDFDASRASHVAFELVQMVREGVSNAARHGHAREIRIAIDEEGLDRMQLRILDNGAGFPETVAGEQTSLGERAIALGGSASHTRVDGWTHVTISIPIGAKKWRG